MNEKHKPSSTPQPEEKTKKKDKYCSFLHHASTYKLLTWLFHVAWQNQLLQFVFKSSLGGLQENGQMQMLKKRLYIIHDGVQRFCMPDLVLDVYCT